MHARRKEEGREKEEISSSKRRSKVEIQYGEAKSLSLIGWKDEQDRLGGVGVDGGTKEDWMVEKQKFYLTPMGIVHLHRRSSHTMIDGGDG